MQKTLYLCYFWLNTPLVQTQVLPYLREIAKGGVKVFLLTFEQNPKENWTKQAIADERKKLAEQGIEWHFLTYHKTPSVPATLYDIFNGARFARKLAKKEAIDVFHGRVHIPMLMGWLAKKTLRTNPKLLFDIRGFFPEEYVDAGIWEQNSKVYLAAKRVEKWLLRDSDGFVTLTEKARDILFPESVVSGFDKDGRPVEVIPCCVDFSRFDETDSESRRKMRSSLNIEDRLVIVYVGSFGGFYMAKETADFYEVAKSVDPGTFALILTQTPKDLIEPLLKKRGFTEDDYFIQSVDPNEVPRYLGASDFAVSFIKPSYSKLASSPTKNAEYLASGLPILVNSKIGDTSEMLSEDETGVVIDEFTTEAFREAFSEILGLLENKEKIRAKCKKSAMKRFDLMAIGGRRYLRLYKNLLRKPIK